MEAHPTQRLAFNKLSQFRSGSAACDGDLHTILTKALHKEGSRPQSTDATYLCASEDRGGGLRVRTLPYGPRIPECHTFLVDQPPASILLLYWHYILMYILGRLTPPASVAQHSTKNMSNFEYLVLVFSLKLCQFF